MSVSTVRLKEGLKLPFIKLQQCTQICVGANAVIRVKLELHHPTSGGVRIKLNKVMNGKKLPPNKQILWIVFVHDTLLCVL